MVQIVSFGSIAEDKADKVSLEHVTALCIIWAYVYPDRCMYPRDP